jgi:RNA polymerase sigma-70 factor (ECF subfamily)
MSPIETFSERILPLKNKLLRVAFSIVRQTEEAEDIVQEVMLKIWDRRSDWLKLNSCEGYCVVMARNMSLDFLRRKKLPLLSLDEAQSAWAKDENVLEKMWKKEAAAEVQQRMQSLPEKQFLSLQLREVEEKSYTEIAETLSITIEQVKTNIHRARKSLRMQLTKTTE